MPQRRRKKRSTSRSKRSPLPRSSGPSYTLNSVPIPESISAAAVKLKEGTLKGQVITRVYAADDPSVAKFLKALGESNEAVALNTLAHILRFAPMRISHPYIWDIIQFLWASWFIAEEFRNEWMAKLVTAWAEGMTVGWRVSIRKPAARRRGRPPVLFPKLSGRDGWLPSAAANEEKRDAMNLIQYYMDLHHRLKSCGEWGWKELGQEFRANPDDTVEMVAEEVGKSFEKFKQDHGVRGVPLRIHELRSIVRQGLMETYKGRPLRHEIVCQLLARLSWCKTDGTPQSVNSGLIHKTLETLRKNFGKEWLKDFREIRGYSTRAKKQCDKLAYRRIVVGPPTRPKRNSKV